VALAVRAGDLALEFVVKSEIAAEQSRIAIADAVGLNAGNGGGLHSWTCRDSEIVVGTE
jgi:hypothetical protein